MVRVHFVIFDFGRKSKYKNELNIKTNILVLFRAQLFFAGVLTDNPFLSTYLMTIIDIVAYLVTPFLNKILKRKSVFLLYFTLLTFISLLGIFNGPKLVCFLLR